MWHKQRPLLLARLPFQCRLNSCSWFIVPVNAEQRLMIGSGLYKLLLPLKLITSGPLTSPFFIRTNSKAHYHFLPLRHALYITIGRSSCECSRSEVYLGLRPLIFIDIYLKGFISSFSCKNIIFIYVR